MSKSLFDAIGREKAVALMESGFLRAIKENETLGLGHACKGKKLCMVDGVLCMVGDGRSEPLRPSQSAPALNKRVPIA